MARATIHYFSRSLGKASSLDVIFPDDPATPRPWGAFYLLHGLSDDQTIWGRRTSLERYVGALPMAVVMPDGGRGWYTNAARPGGPAHEDDLVRDVVGLIDRTFPVRAERAGRAIGGLSMGGYGAVKIGLKHHETFASVNSHSGAPGIAREVAPPEPARPDDRFKDIRAELRGVFGDRPAGGPDDPFALAERVDHGRVPKMRIDCGADDFLLGQNRDFHRHLDALHVPHEYQEFPGDHNWEYWDLHVREAIAFHARNLGLATH